MAQLNPFPNYPVIRLTDDPEKISQSTIPTEAISEVRALVHRYIEQYESGSSLGDFIDLSGFVAKLRTLQDPISGYLWNQFSASTQKVLRSVTSTPEQQKLALVQALNNILKGVLIYETARFARVTLSPETQALKSQNPHGTDLIRLNRLLLEDAYPLEIAKSNESAQPAKTEAMIIAVKGDFGSGKTHLLLDALGQFQSGFKRNSEITVIRVPCLETDPLTWFQMSIAPELKRPFLEKLVVDSMRGQVS